MSFKLPATVISIPIISVALDVGDQSLGAHRTRLRLEAELAGRALI